MTHYRTGQYPGTVLDWVFANSSEKPNGCREWNGPRNRGGYGVGLVDGKPASVARHVMEAIHGPLTRHQLSCHHCDNPACVNPEHIYVGTAKQNAQDTKNRGRLRPGNSGGRIPNYKRFNIDPFTNERVSPKNAPEKAGEAA